MLWFYVMFFNITASLRKWICFLVICFVLLYILLLSPERKKRTHEAESERTNTNLAITRHRNNYIQKWTIIIKSHCTVSHSLSVKIRIHIFLLFSFSSLVLFLFRIVPLSTHKTKLLNSMNVPNVFHLICPCARNTWKLCVLCVEIRWMTRAFFFHQPKVSNNYFYYHYYSSPQRLKVVKFFA